ncbi:MAG TPA: hypothetical protein VGM06_09080 [Polyangiaceae bacterium]|jgi:hypothetical protein
MMTSDEKDSIAPVPLDSRQVCVDCGRQSPPTESNFTLISARHGWRLTRFRDPSGRSTGQWRCPDCWRKHRGGAR